MQESETVIAKIPSFGVKFIGARVPLSALGDLREQGFDASVRGSLLKQGVELVLTFITPRVVYRCCRIREGLFLSNGIGDIHVQCGRVWCGAILG